jgi:hypothetical protein
MQALLDELTDAAIDMDGEREAEAAGIRLRLHEALIAGNHLDGARATAAEILHSGFEKEITPATWDRLQDQIARESERAQRALEAERNVASTILSVLHGTRPSSAPHDDLREALEALYKGRITRDHAHRILEAFNEAEMI